MGAATVTPKQGATEIETMTILKTVNDLAEEEVEKGVEVKVGKSIGIEVQDPSQQNTESTKKRFKKMTCTEYATLQYRQK